MISFRDFALRRGQHLLLSGIDLALHDGWRVGVVGRNGCGKSSLFAALTGELEADHGDLEMSPRLRIASVAQETPSLPDAALDFVLGGDAQVAAAIRDEADAMAREDYEGVAHAHHRLEELNGYDATARAARLLHGLGFPADTHARPVSTFSGGWRVRLNLARALMMPSDLLLLDEPTNHLDLDAVLWLEQWLLKYPGTLLLISHDREFLDGVSTHILHLHDGRARLYTGDYTRFEHQRAEHLHQQQIAFEKEQAEREHLQRFIARFKAKASKATQAQSRMKRLAKLAGTEAVRAERALHIDFIPPAKLPHALIRLRHADAGYGDLRVLHDIGFGLDAGDRVGLLGPNGAGKSTLVKTLVGELPLLAGERNAHPELVMGYFAQHTVESLRSDQSPIDHLRDIAPNESTQSFRNFLGRWNFPGDRAFENVNGFSGGERARLALALIAWRKPNVLLLDEPTNHLDLDMREALAEALVDFPGAIVLVSHDRHLIGLVCETFWRVARGRVEAFDGDLDDYAAWLRSRPANDSRQPEPPVVTAPAVRKTSKPNPHRVAKLETHIAELQGEISLTESRLTDPAAYAAGAARSMQMATRLDALRVELDAAETALLELYASDMA